MDNSVSPPRQGCCFCYSSSKKLATKKAKNSGVAELDIDGRDWGKNDEILSDMSTFSLKEQQKKLKKALKEEEKVTREAEKVVDWVKQASARIDISAIEEILSENEKSK
ncbi:uncharacterized protein LOC122080397 [Macadamia integrifolia]|uniref:uncharacterized protein LOC122080397 n=1 Tax=Macadamia integrifolia TaxID=60698 RepID=UPI001C4F7774|nr:uncharacterized protein LOC122080397 [Macadamia integrifolia]